MNDDLADHTHHPDDLYTPQAFRHYIRRIALLKTLQRTTFKTALDVGCAEGFFMRAIGERFGAEVWGVDISNIAAEKVHAAGMPAAAAEATKLPFADGSFDLVYATEVIEHVLDPDLMLAEMRRVSRGIVLVTTPVSASEDEHEPDYEIKDEGHVNNFDRRTVERIFGPQAKLDSFRCNASFALVKGFGRYLPAPLRDAFYDFDHTLATRIGKDDSRLAALRNRDWLITISGVGAGEGKPQWRCPTCHGPLSTQESASELRCEGCHAVYPLAGGAPDFFSSQAPPAS